MTGPSEATDLRAQCGEEGLRLGEFGELLCRREALDRRRQHRVGIGVAIGRAIKLCQRQRGTPSGLIFFHAAPSSYVLVLGINTPGGYLLRSISKGSGGSP